MECSQPATLCCYCCCFSFFGVVAMSGFFFLFFLSPVGYKTGCSFPAIVESCDGPPVASIASVRSPAQVNESRRNSQKFLQKEREKKRWVGENIRDMATTRPLILSLSLSLPRHRTPLCKSENSPSHTAHTHKRVKHPERSRLDGQVGGWFDAPGHQTVPQHDRDFIIHFSAHFFFFFSSPCWPRPFGIFVSLFSRTKRRKRAAISYTNYASREQCQWLFYTCVCS